MEPIELLAEITKTIAVVSGVIISVWSYRTAQLAQAQARQVEASKPFWELRQNLYREALRAAAVLANPTAYKKAERDEADRRFRSLYVAELSMVETSEVEEKMKGLAGEIAPDLLELTSAQDAAYHLAHALRDSFAGAGWGGSAQT